jgi:lipid-binding SYLF domain-containing protein
MIPFALADDKKDVSDEVKRMDSAATVMNEIMGTPDKGIPQEILSSAKCVAVVPSMLKGGFVVGANYGKGVATCHTATGWSAPAPFKLAGGSVGFQIGGEAVDVVMLIMNEKGMRNLLNSKFKLGADASVAAGPVGRHAEGDTDWKMRAEVLSYSRARGVFAGVSLNGAGISQDNDETQSVWQRCVVSEDPDGWRTGPRGIGNFPVDREKVLRRREGRRKGGKQISSLSVLIRPALRRWAFLFAGRFSRRSSSQGLNPTFHDLPAHNFGGGRGRPPDCRRDAGVTVR